MSINVFIEYFKDRHTEVIGHPYAVTWGKDNKILKDLFAVYGAMKLTQIMDAFFERMKKDEFLKKTGASIGVMKSQIPKLLLNLGNADSGTKGKL